MPCKFCDDGDGKCAFPYYGVAPHEHDGADGAILGMTRLLPKEQWGENFRQDPQVPWCGTYLRCEFCGDGEPTMHDIDAEDEIIFGIKTAPGDLEEDKHSTSGMGMLLLYAVGLVSLIAALVMASS